FFYEAFEMARQKNYGAATQSINRVPRLDRVQPFLPSCQTQQKVYLTESINQRRVGGGIACHQSRCAIIISCQIANRRLVRRTWSTDLLIRSVNSSFLKSKAYLFLNVSRMALARSIESWEADCMIKSKRALLMIFLSGGNLRKHSSASNQMSEISTDCFQASRNSVTFSSLYFRPS